MTPLHASNSAPLHISTMIIWQNNMKLHSNIIASNFQNLLSISFILSLMNPTTLISHRLPPFLSNHLPYFFFRYSLSFGDSLPRYTRLRSNTVQLSPSGKFIFSKLDASAPGIIESFQKTCLSSFP